MAKFTLDQLEKLEDAIAKGVKKVKYQDKEVEYRTLDEMLRLRDVMRKGLGLTKKCSRLFARTSKGLC